MSPSKLTKYCACHAKWQPNIWQKFAENSWNVISNARPIRDRSEHDPINDPRPFPPVRNPPRNRGYFSRSGRSICIEKYNISRSGYLSKFHQVLRLPWKVTLEPSPSTAPATKSDTWPSPSTAPATKSETSASPKIAPATKSDTWPSPTTAPATKSDTWASPKYRACHTEWLACLILVTYETSFTMRGPIKVTLQTSKLTKYCACHAKWPSNIWQKFAENSWNVISNARPIRDRSENDPITFRGPFRDRSVSPQPATHRGYFSRSGRTVCIWKIQHFALRLSFQISPSTAPTTKSNTWTSPSTAPTTKSDTWTSPSTAPTTQSDTWPSPTTVPTTQSDTWNLTKYLRLPRKRSITQRFYSAILLSDLLSDSLTLLRLLLSDLLLRDSINWLYYYAAIVLDSTTTQRLYLTLLLRTDCTWLYYHAAIVIDSTPTQRLYLTLLLRSDCTWLYYYAAIAIDSTTTQRLYLTLLLRSDCAWLYYYAAIVLDSTLTQRLTLLLRSDCNWLYS